MSLKLTLHFLVYAVSHTCEMPRVRLVVALLRLWLGNKSTCEAPKFWISDKQKCMTLSKCRGRESNFAARLASKWIAVLPIADSIPQCKHRPLEMCHDRVHLLPRCCGSVLRPLCYCILKDFPLQIFAVHSRFLQIRQATLEVKELEFLDRLIGASTTFEKLTFLPVFEWVIVPLGPWRQSCKGWGNSLEYKGLGIRICIRLKLDCAATLQSLGMCHAC